MTEEAYALGSKSSYFIMIIAIAILALTSAALASYIFFVQGTPEKEAVASTEASATGVPKEEELVKIPLYEEKRVFNLKSDDPDKASMIQVNATLKCIKKLKYDKKAVVEEKIASYSEEIQELIVKFFLTKKIDEVKDVATMDKASEVLTEQINELLNKGSDHPEDIVYKVIFSEWIFQ